MPNSAPLDRFLGCLLGSAVGDALGAPLEGLSPQQVRAHYGRVRNYVDGVQAWKRKRYRWRMCGLYSDDTQRLGMLSCAAWRAVRLVVDTGLHARGWSRERAREFALSHSPMPEDFVNAEIDRYIALPGQALGYLIGQREILRLREHARVQLGAAFDIRDFHSAVLDHGALPLTVLRGVVEDWVRAKQGGQI